MVRTRSVAVAMAFVSVVAACVVAASAVERLRRSSGAVGHVGCVSLPGSAQGRRSAFLAFAVVAVTALIALLTPPPASATGGFVFTAAGDHDDGDRFRAGVDVVASSGSNFYLALGDLSYTVGGEQQWCSYFKSRFNDVEVVAGNHDTGESAGGQIENYVTFCPFTLGPWLVGDYGTQYYFDYPQAAPLARFIMIAPGVEGSLNLDYSATGAGYAFTRDAIDSARAAGVKWIVVGMHKNCITTGSKSCEIGPDLMRLLIEKRVDLVLQGHDHNFQRSHALRCVQTGAFDPSCVSDNGSDGIYTKGSGAVVLINGEFGRSLYQVSSSDSEAGYFARIDSTTFGVTRYTVTETSIVGEYLASDNGGFADRFTITSDGAPPPPPPPPTTTLTFRPTDDARIARSSPGANYGAASSVGVDNSPVEHSLLKFSVSGVNGRRVTAARLRLYVADSSNVGGRFHRLHDTSWGESTVTWASAPLGDAGTVATLGGVTKGTWAEVDLSSVVTGDGTFALRVDSTSTNGADYNSKEAGSNRPELVVMVEEGPAVADTEPPSTPTELTATAVNHGRVDLTWGAATDNVGVSGYIVFRDGVSIATTSGSTAYSDLSPQANTTYTYRVVASDRAGNSSTPSNEASVVTPAPPPAPTTLSFTPTDDSRIGKGSPTTNYGTSSIVTADNSPVEHFLMKFHVAGVNGRRVTSAKLRLFVRSPSNAGGNFRRLAETSWMESTVTWNSAPAADAATLTTLGAVALSSWVEVDLSGLVTGDGTFAVRVDSTSTDGADYSSKEATSNRPQLVVTVE